MGGIQTQAGVILPDGTLTTRAKQRFVEAVIAELQGTVEVPLPCGPELVPDPGIAIENLGDESLFPEFHDKYLGPNGLYTKLSVAMDIKGQNPAPLFQAGILDIAHLAVQLGASVPPIEFPLQPLLPPDIIAALPDAALTPPDIVNIAASLPGLSPPALEIPQFTINPKYEAVITFNLRILNLFITLPQVFLDLAGQLPNIITNLPVELPKVICAPLDVAFEAVDPKHTLDLAATKVTVNRFAENAEFVLIGSLLGCPDPDIAGYPGQGVVGALATEKGLGIEADEDKVQEEIQQEQQEATQEEQQIRDNAVQLIESFVPSGARFGLSDPGQVKFRDITQLSERELAQDEILISTCGFLPNFMLYRLGVRDADMINREVPSEGLSFVEGANLSKLEQGARRLGAWVPFQSWTRDKVRPKRGDILFIASVTNGGGAGDAVIGGETANIDQVNTRQHVFVFLDERTERINGSNVLVWRSADAGLGGIGAQSANFRNRAIQEGRSEMRVIDQGPGGGDVRKLQGWIDIARLPYTAAPNLGGPETPADQNIGKPG